MPSPTPGPLTPGRPAPGPATAPPRPAGPGLRAAPLPRRRGDAGDVPDPELDDPHEPPGVGPGPAPDPTAALSGAEAAAFILGRVALCDRRVSDEERAYLADIVRGLPNIASVDALLDAAARHPLPALAARVDNPADRLFLALRAWTVLTCDHRPGPSDLQHFLELEQALQIPEDDRHRLMAAVDPPGGRLDPALERWLRAQHARSTFPSAGLGDPLEGERGALAAARRLVEDELLSAYDELSTLLLPDAGPGRVAAVSAWLRAPALLEQLDDLERQVEADTERLALIEQSELWQQCTSPGTPACVQRRAALERRIAELHERRAAFNQPDFQWLYDRNHACARDSDPFQSFLRVVTFAGLRERRAEATALQALGAPDFRSAVAELHRIDRELRQLTREVDRLHHDESALDEIRGEHGDLCHRLADEGARRLSELRARCATALAQADLAALARGADAVLADRLAAAHLQEARLKLLDELITAADRLAEARAAAAAAPPPSDDPELGPVVDPTSSGELGPDEVELRVRERVPVMAAARRAALTFDDPAGWARACAGGAAHPWEVLRAAAPALPQGPLRAVLPAWADGA